MSKDLSSNERISQLGAGFMPACVLGAAAELDLFTRLGDRALPADQLAAELDGDPRAVRILLDAVASLDLLEKEAGRYSVPAMLGWRPTSTKALPLPTSIS